MLAFARLNVLMIFFMSLIIKAVLHVSGGFWRIAIPMPNSLISDFAIATSLGLFLGLRGRLLPVYA